MSFTKFLEWARKREQLNEDDDFFVYTEAYYEKASLLLTGLEYYLDTSYKTLYYNLALHYIITNNYTNEDGKHSSLYNKYKIDEKGFITSSASDESSSASIHITKSLSEGDFIMMDLIRTPYGQYVYSILEQTKVGPILL